MAEILRVCEGNGSDRDRVRLMLFGRMRNSIEVYTLVLCSIIDSGENGNTDNKPHNTGRRRLRN